MPEQKQLTVKCPQCGTPVKWEPASKYRPFCSQRCRQLDLGAWASEEYRVAADAPPDDDQDPPRES